LLEQILLLFVPKAREALHSIAAWFASEQLKTGDRYSWDLTKLLFLRNHLG